MRKLLSLFILSIHTVKSFIYKKMALVKVEKHGENIYIHGKCVLSRNTFLGNNVNMNGLEVAGSGKVTIGDNFHSGPGCLLITSNHNYDYGETIPYDKTTICKEITIKDNVWLGSRVIVLPGVTIGEGAIIQAGAVVTSNIQAGGIAGGNPAKVFKLRDMKHYEKLKNEKQFF